MAARRSQAASRAGLLLAGLLGACATSASPDAATRGVNAPVQAAREAAPVDAAAAFARCEQARAADNAAAMPACIEAAEAGHPQARLLVGTAYLEGRGVARDREIALRYLRACADDGIGACAARAGEIVAAGDVVPADPAESVRLWRIGAELGDPHATYLLAGRAVQGRGMARDLVLARRLYAGIAPKSAAYAHAWAGFLHEHGRETSDAREALYWWHMADAGLADRAGRCDELRAYESRVAAAERAAVAQRVAADRAARGEPPAHQRAACP